MIAEFLIYEGKVAVLMAVFYLFYRLLLSRETLHAVNRVVLIATAVSSFILPIIHLTRYRTVAYPDITLEAGEGAIDPTALTEMAGESPWILFLFGVFILGAFIIITRIAFAIVKVRRILSKGRPIILEDGTEITVIEEDIAPFSWMGSIVMSRDDYESGNKHIIAHEKAHIAFRHSIDILIVDTLSAFQWFNPVMWMLLSDLRAIHEYEADDVVLKKGADIREYQYSLIKKAVSGSGYSITNSFNHSILKNRITMMSKPKSVTSRGLRALYVIPLLAAGLACNSQTVTDYKVSENPTGTKGDVQNYPVPTEIRLQVVHEGEGASFYVNGEKVSLDGIGEKVIEARGDADFPYVSIIGDPDVKLGIIQDVKEELRKIEYLRIMYSCKNPEVKVERKLERSGATRSIPELMEGSNEGDVQVRLNSLDKLLYLRTGGKKDINVINQEDLFDLAKNDIEKNNGISFFFIADRGSSYGAYSVAVQSVYDAFRSVREDLAMQAYGKTFDELEEGQQNELREKCSVRIFETSK